MNALDLREVSRVFSHRFALRRIDLRLGREEFALLTGPNGSGKTTLLRIMATLLAPSSGAVSVLGKNAREEKSEIRRQIGALFAHGFLHDDLTVAENLLFYARLYRLDYAEAEVRRWVDRLQMQRFLREPVRHLSRGERQKVALIRTLLPSPRLLLLDEPTTGLDRETTDFLCRELKERRKKCAAVCVTHQPSLFDGIFDREWKLLDGRLQ